MRSLSSDCASGTVRARDLHHGEGGAVVEELHRVDPHVAAGGVDRGQILAVLQRGGDPVGVGQPGLSGVPGDEAVRLPVDEQLVDAALGERCDVGIAEVVEVALPGRC